MMAASDQLDIAAVVQHSGLPVSTLHVWEKRGLIKPTGRRGLRRQYDPNVLEQIAAIVLYQRGGFSLAEIAQLIEPDGAGEAKERIARKLEQLRRRAAELETAIAGLEHALACRNPSPMECPDFQEMLDDVLPVARR